jgi:hypothetical protein
MYTVDLHDPSLFGAVLHILSSLRVISFLLTTPFR